MSSFHRVAGWLFIAGAPIAGLCQSLDGAWSGRLECSAPLPGISTPSDANAAYGAQVSFTMQGGAVSGTREDRASVEAISGSLAGRRLVVTLDGKRKDRPSWWRTTLSGTVTDGVAQLEGFMTTPDGLRKIRACSLEVRSLAWEAAEASARARADEQRAAAERDDAERARAERAMEDERAARQAAEAREKQALEDLERARAQAQHSDSAAQPARASARAATPALPVSPTPKPNTERAAARAATERSAAEKAAAEKAAAEKAAADRAAAESAAEQKATMDKAAADKAAVDKAAAEKAMAEKAAADNAAAAKAAAEQAAAKAKQERSGVRANSTMDL